MVTVYGNDLTYKEHKFVLCKARHSHPEIDGLEPIFDTEIDPMDFDGMLRTVNHLFAEKFADIEEDLVKITLYVTGLTGAAMAVVAACIQNNYRLILMHYDRSQDKYVSQVMPTCRIENYL